MIRSKISGVFIDPPPSNTFPEVIYIFTHPNQRRMGIGSHLISDNELFLKEIGVYMYVVKSWDDITHPSVKFYIKSGFVLDTKVNAAGKKLRYMKKTLIK